ncbi:MAG: hypothetical protein KTR35_17020 [Gammaproteobacteria bacterium]|nr:hypothetical protein [Gammaproteobacteria bacterium]
MSHLLFRLRNVPDEEASAVRSLLEEHQIPFFETSAGNWGISMPGLWLEEDQDIERATQLLEQFQKEYRENARAIHQQKIESGEWPSFFEKFLAQPGLMLLAISFCVFIIYISIQPFLSLIR